MRFPAALTELIGVLDHGAVLTDAPDLVAHVTPWRGIAGDARAVVLPSDTAQVRSVVAWAREHRVRLIPQGANTGLVGASTPPPGSNSVVLCTDRLRRPFTIDAVDRTATVGAGVRLSELNAAAATHGLRLPIDLAADPSLGGMVASNTGGSRMLRHGDMRRSLLGLKAVLADTACSVVDELSTLRKHNVGPSIGQLLVGAGGAFAVITEVAVELQPIPQNSSCAWLVPRSLDDVIPILLAAEISGATELSAFEVLSSGAFSAACSLGSVKIRPFGTDAPLGHSILIEMEGGPEVESHMVELLSSLDDDQRIQDAVVLPCADAWSLRHSVSDGLAHRGGVVGLDVSVPRPRLPELIRRATSSLAESHPNAQLCDFGHWGDGGVHCNVVIPHTSDSLPLDDEVRAGVRDVVLGIVAELGGSFSAEHGIGPWNADRWLAGTSVGTRRALAALACAVDPLDLMGHPGLPYRDR